MLQWSVQTKGSWILCPGIHSWWISKDIQASLFYLYLLTEPGQIFILSLLSFSVHAYSWWFSWGANFCYFLLSMTEQSRNFHPRKLMPTVQIRKYRWGAWPKTLWKRSHLLSVLASNNRYCHPADGVLNILASHPIYFLAEVAQILRACIDYIVCSALRPWTGLLSRNLKPRKLILRASSDFPRKLAPLKITRHTVCVIPLDIGSLSPCSVLMSIKGMSSQ